MTHSDAASARRPSPPPTSETRCRVPTSRKVRTQKGVPRGKRGGCGIAATMTLDMLVDGGYFDLTMQVSAHLEHAPPPVRCKLLPGPIGRLCAAWRTAVGPPQDFVGVSARVSRLTRCTLQDAATSLKVGVTTLKKVCRLHGIRRWPYRRRSFIHKLTQQAEMRHGRAAIAAAERVREVSGSLGPAAPPLLASLPVRRPTPPLSGCLAAAPTCPGSGRGRLRLSWRWWEHACRAA